MAQGSAQKALTFDEASHGAAHASLRAERITSNQSIPDTTATTIIYNSIIHEDDPDGDLSFNTTTGVLTVNTTGVYLISAGLRYANNTTGSRRFEVSVGGTLIGGFNDAAFNNFWKAMSVIYKVTAAQTVSVQTVQNAGVAVDIVADPLTFFAVARLY